MQQESWHQRALSGPKLVGLGAHPRSTKPSQNPFIRTETGGFWGAHPNRKTPLSGPKLVGYGAHLAPRHHRKTPLSGPKLVDSGVHTASQNSFMRSIAKPLCQDRILPLGHYNDLILGKVKTSKRPCKRFRVTVSKPEARFGVAACLPAPKQAFKVKTSQRPCRRV